MKTFIGQNAFDDIVDFIEDARGFDTSISADHETITIKRAGEVLEIGRGPKIRIPDQLTEEWLRTLKPCIKYFWAKYKLPPSVPVTEEDLRQAFVLVPPDYIDWVCSKVLARHVLDKLREAGGDPDGGGIFDPVRYKQFAVQAFLEAHKSQSRHRRPIVEAAEKLAEWYDTVDRTNVGPSLDSTLYDLIKGIHAAVYPQKQHSNVPSPE